MDKTRCPECGGGAKLETAVRGREIFIEVRCDTCGSFATSVPFTKLSKLFDSRGNIACTYNPYWDKSLTIGELPAWRAAAMVREDFDEMP